MTCVSLATTFRTVSRAIFPLPTAGAVRYAAAMHLPPAVAIFGATLPMLLLASCHRITEADQQAAIATVRTNLAAMEKGDLDAVMATIHPDSPAYNNTPELVRGMIAQFKLHYELEHVAVEAVAGDSIRVGFVQATYKLSGPDDFQDSRLSGVHVAKRDGKAWKIWFTQVRRVEALEASAPERKTESPVKPGEPAQRPPSAGGFRPTERADLFVAVARHLR